MSIERTLSIIKPDAVAKNAIGQIYARFEAAGLKVVAARMAHLSRAEAEAFYAVHKELQRARDEGGAVALGRVLTLVITTTKDRAEKVIEAANQASREHPMRIIVISEVPDGFTDVPLDAEIRLGGDAGASEVIILNAADELVVDPQGLINGLLLPDAPMVAWWPDAAPAHMSETSLGRVAGHRIADTIYTENPVDLLRTLAECYEPDARPRILGSAARAIRRTSTMDTCIARHRAAVVARRALQVHHREVERRRVQDRRPPRRRVEVVVARVVVGQVGVLDEAPERIGTPGVVPRHMMAPPQWIGGCVGCICARTAECRPSAATSSAPRASRRRPSRFSSSATTPAASLR